MNAIIARALVSAALFTAVLTVALSSAEHDRRTFTYFATPERIR